MRTSVILAVAFAMATAMTGRPAFSQSGQAQYSRNDSQLMRKYGDASVFYEKARKSFDKKDLKGTREALEDTLRLIPEFADAHLLMAKVFYIENDFAQALNEVLQAKAGHMATVALWEQMQMDRMTGLRKRRQEKEESLGELRAQLATVPADQKQKVQQQISQVERDLEEIDRVLYRPAPAMNQMPAEYLFFHGNVLLRMENYSEAAAQYHEALKSNPGYGEAANNLASLYYSTQQYEKALAIVKEVEAHGATVNPELKKAIERALRQPR